MKQVELKISYELRITEGTDAILLNLDLSAGTQLRARISGNGATNNMVMQAKNAKDPVSPFLAAEPEQLAALFDPTFTLANKIDSQWLVERLLAKREAINADEHMVDRIKGLTVISNLMGLHAVGNEVMNALYGYNWVVEQSASLVKQSKDWLALIERIKVAQETLKDALPT